MPYFIIGLGIVSYKTYIISVLALLRVKIRAIHPDDFVIEHKFVCLVLVFEVLYLLDR